MLQRWTYTVLTVLPGFALLGHEETRVSAKTNAIVPSLHPSGTELAHQIERILHSEVFAGSEILRKLLAYLSARAMEARIEPIRVKEIATEVFGRSEDFDSQGDSVVRVHTGRLRSKLAEYYMEEGAEDDVIVTVPKGGYTLAYHFRQANSPAVPVHQNPAELREPVPEHGSPSIGSLEPRQPGRSISLQFAAILTVSAIALGWFASGMVHTRLERNKLPFVLRTFWQDFAAKDETPLIVFSNFRLIKQTDCGHIYNYGGGDRRI
jgi:DNA-binding winged helix-turn-helix (wHTH) protein